MRGKVLLIVGLAAGYVLGARAGRERYDDIKRVAGNLWHDPKVQRQVRNAEDFAKDKAPEVVDFLTDGAKKVASQVSGSTRRATASKSASTRKPASRSTKSASSKSASSE
ncbi:MAG: hypothetical protein JWO01_785 [Microbacteriaceae bacterium]|jgi:hypothetical protein|nr:hypothetical protein [Microbacteriaceae bacterium]